MALSIEVRTSGIWQMTSAVLSSGGAALVIDPGYFPRELAELCALARARGAVTGVVFTHGHWDHVMGWRSFPDAEVLTSSSLHDVIVQGGEQAEKNLRDAADFDRRWYIDRGASPAWPPLARTRALAEGEVISIGDAQLMTLQLPGHSADGIALWERQSGVILVGDYLSPCEIPFVEDLTAYRATLRRLLQILPEIDRVLPGHGPALDRKQAQTIARADLAYLDALAECAARGDSAAAQAVPLPRTAEIPEMREHHLDNCRAALR